MFLHNCINIFPKRDRYTIGAKLEQFTLEFFELMMLAREKEGASKLLILQKADVKLKILKLFTRMSFDTKSLPEKKYIEAEKKLLEIGKMLGGWIRQANTKGLRKEALVNTSGERDA